MAFLTGKVKLLAYKDSAETEFPKQKIVDEDFDFEDLTVTAAQPCYVALAALGSVTISFTGLGTVNTAYIISDSQNITVNLNGLGNLTLRAGIPCLIPATLTSMVVTNASASTATNVEVVLISG